MTKGNENICFSSEYHLCAGGVQGKDSCNVRHNRVNRRMRDNGCGLHDDGKF